MFPSGLPGAALLVLRTSVALPLICGASGSWQDLSPIFQVIGLSVSVALCAGYMTPVAAVVALLFHAMVLWSQGFNSGPLDGIVLLDALSLALLGPGAYSVDSYRFGRRVVVWPRR
jgi:uncharacterized membrane protein YphA (DoxX/SURF4 family)